MGNRKRRATSPRLGPLALAVGLAALWTGCAGREQAVRQAVPAVVERPPAPAPVEPPAPELGSAELAGSLQAHLGRGEVEAALAEFERALASAGGAGLAGALRPEDRLLHARLLMLAGRTEDSRQELERLEAETAAGSEGGADEAASGETAGGGTAGPQSSSLRAEIAFQRALLAGLRGDRPAEEELLERALQLKANFPEVLTARAELHLRDGRYEEAECGFAAALEEAPGLEPALVGLAGVRLHQGRTAEALELLDRAVRLASDHALAWQERARARVQAEDFAGAVEDLTRALDLDPQSYWARLDRGRLYLRVGNGEAARSDFDEAVKIEPELFAAWAYRAGLNYEEDRLEEARSDFERVIVLRPDYGPAYAPLGALYYIRKNWERAEHTFREGVRLSGPEFEYGDPAQALMAALAMLRDGGERRVQGFLGPFLDRLPPESWVREVGRFLVDPALEMRLLDRIEREKNPIVRARMLFYVAARAQQAGRVRQAQSCLLEARDRLPGEYWEGRLARWILKEDYAIDG